MWLCQHFSFFFWFHCAVEQFRTFHFQNVLCVGVFTVLLFSTTSFFGFAFWFIVVIVVVVAAVIATFNFGLHPNSKMKTPLPKKEIQQTLLYGQKQTTSTSFSWWPEIKMVKSGTYIPCVWQEACTVRDFV